MELANLKRVVVGARRGWLAARVMAGVAMVTTAAIAQPGNPGPDPATRTIVDMGDVGPGTDTFRDAALTTGGIVWFRFRLTEAINPFRNWLDLDTSGPTTLTDPDMAVYDTRGNKLYEDAQSGGATGSPATQTAAAISLGGGSGLRLSRSYGATYNEGGISTGRHGPSLGAGVYWVGVAAGPATFRNPNPNWDVASSSTLTGTTRLTIKMGRVPATTWNETTHSADSGELVDTAQVVSGTGPLTNILCDFTIVERDMFRILICDPASFRAAASVSQYNGALNRVRLYLFDANGHGVLATNNTVQNTVTTLARPNTVPTFPAGEYFLAISSVCDGYMVAGTDYGPGVPFSAANRTLWDFQTNNQSIRPDGPGASEPMLYWGRQANCTNPDGRYANITLTGACFIESATPPCIADVDDGTGTGTPDGGVSIDDLLYFLSRFTDGC